MIQFKDYITEDISTKTRKETKLLVDEIYSRYIDKHDKNSVECVGWMDGIENSLIRFQKIYEGGIGDDDSVLDVGCGSAIASSSLATEWVKDKSIDEAMAIQNTVIVEELSLPPVKIHCSVLAEDAIKAAITDYRKKNGIVR